jgi:hypothetical protein
MCAVTRSRCERVDGWLSQVVHFLWEVLPLADFSTQFLVDNPDVDILMPNCDLCIQILETLWAPYVGGGC